MNRFFTGAIWVGLMFVLFSARLEARGEQVVPIDFSRFSNAQGVAVKDEIGTGLARIVQYQSRYLLKWLAANHEVKSDLPEWKGVPCYYPAFRYGWEQAVRPLSHISWGVAVMIKTGIYSSEIAGISQAEATTRLELAIRGAAFTHLVNTASGKRWGDMWQSAYWSSETAEAAWLLWDKLSDETKLAVEEMLEHEANRFIDYAVPYYADKTGKVVRPGNTAAEENAWNSRVLVAAFCMMPKHPNKDNWYTKACELMISAYSRPSDLNNNTMIDGKPVKDWINGYNALEPGLVINHGRIHPDYMACVYFNCTTTLDCSLANVPVPQSAYFNLDVVYHALTAYKFTPGPSPWTDHQIEPPGGTIYRRRADGTYDPATYYPESADWTNVSYDNMMLDLYAKLRGLDAGKDFDCTGWVCARMAEIIKLQNRPGHDGNIYEKGDWLTDYRSTDATSFQAIAEAWMLWWLMQHKMVAPVACRWGADGRQLAELECQPAAAHGLLRGTSRRQQWTGNPPYATGGS